MDTVATKPLVHPNLAALQSSSLDETDEGSLSPRRNSSNERARQNLLAQRRQSQIQLMQEMSGRQTPTTLIPLTCAQIHLVRSLWRQIYTSKGPTVIGTSIYHRLCFKCPQVKEQIRRVPLPPKFQNYDSFIKAHSKAIGELIDQVVDNLDNLDNMAGELIRVGQVHAKLLRGELTGKLWNVVAETFIDCTLEWGDRRCRSETVRKAWALIVAFVIEKIKVGHHEQRKKMLATRQSLPAIQVPFQSMKI
nr:Globin domain containing protein [Haemonchus contortus]